ncbi:hypothetical protein [Alloyangia pacifica]|uniref:hypothetical protein n=1 Tax=Alloyangia pacifica TaxID=311180 RepID=UPI0031D85D5B
MLISVVRAGEGYSVTLLSSQNAIQDEVHFKLEADALEFAALWRDWAGAEKITRPDDLGAHFTFESA